MKYKRYYDVLLPTPEGKVLVLGTNIPKAGEKK